MLKKISPEIKAKILEESRVLGCVISELAKRYGIRKELIYTWRRRELKESSESKVVKDNFVEAKLSDGFIESKSSQLLKKASLEFEEFKLCMEGSFKSEQIKQILDLLC